ncbi:PAS domain-containing protein [Larkinella sp. GY13]|uniref:PAS domain-containing protein n=1 Tax=Larkinella sp. GY13 TaxID=3453720 RepID=UPI003EECFA2A
MVSKQTPNPNLPRFLAGGGEVGQLLRALDWSKSPLGEPEQWPQSLKTAVSIVLRSSYPMFIWWGPDLINLHNDAYVPLMGHKHPAFLGKPANELWSEIWEESLLPMKNLVFDQQQSIYGQDLMLLLERKEFPEEGYFNFSYSPIIDENGEVGGLFCACHEETNKVLQQRRLETLNALTSRVLSAKTKVDAGHIAIDVLGQNYKDIPFAAFYLIDPDGQKAQLIHCSGIIPEENPFEKTVALADDATGHFWQLKTVVETGQPVRIQGVSKKISKIVRSLTDRLPDSAFILPVQKAGSEQQIGILLVGLNPHRNFDTDYQHFVEQIGSQIATAIDTIERHENEFKQAKQLAEIDRQAQLRIAQNRLKAEDHIRNVINQAPVGIAVLQGTHFVFEAANDAYLNLIGKSAEQTLGKAILDALPEIRNQGILELLNRVVETGEPFFGNEFAVALNRFGKTDTVYVNFVYQPLREADQSVSGIIVVANEVTELVKSKHATQESERQFRNLVIQSPIAMAIFRGTDLIIEIANETMLKTLWKRPFSEVQGKKLLEIFPELHDQPFPDLLAKVYKTGESYTEKEALAYVNTPEGMGKYYLDFEYAPLFGTDQTVSGIMVTVNDVTEKVEARITIYEAEQRSRLAVEAAEMGTYDWDIEHGVFKYSDRLVEIFGLAPNQPHQHSEFSGAIHPDDLPIRARAHEEAFRTGRLHYEARLAQPDHAVHWIRAIGKVIFDAQQKPVRLLGSAIDITQQVVARKNLEEVAEELEKRVAERTLELRNTNAELVRTNHELEQFAYIASHDLQEPLRKIQTFTELLTDTDHDEESSKNLLSKISSSAQRMSALIKDVLEYSRLSRTDELFIKTDLNLILANVKTDFELLIEQKRAVIIQDELPILNAIPQQLNQLFSNLIGNSLKFSEKNPEIRVSSALLLPEEVRATPNLQSDRAYVKLNFKDNGIGFEQQYAEQIFTIFHRLNGRKSYSGTGIGLALCKKIVENHRGLITAESELNKGASFTIYLPT